MKIRFGYLISFILFVHTLGFGQEYTTTSYSKENGLPTDYCYNIVEDNTGFIWIATEAGLCTFDGHEFNIDPYPELAEKEITRIVKDATGRIWLNELSGNVYYLQEGKILELDYPRELTNESRVEICADSLGHLWIAEDNGFGIIGVDIATLEIKYTLKTFEEQFKLLRKFNSNNYPENYVFKNDSLLFEIEDVLCNFPRFNIVQNYENTTYYNSEYNIFCDKNIFYSCFRKTGLIQPILESFRSKLNTIVHGFTVDRHGSLWVATNNGVFRFENPLKAEAKMTEYFSGIRSGSVISDNYNNIWISTLNQGLHKFSETQIYNFSDEHNRNVTAIIEHYGYLVYLTAAGEVIVLDKEGDVVLDEKTNTKVEYGYDIDIIDEHSLIITTGLGLYTLDLQKLKVELLKELSFFKSASIYGNTLWLNAGNSSYLTHFGDSTLTKMPPFKRSYASLPISEEEAYIGTISGLYKTNSETEQTEQICPETIDGYIKSIERASDGTIWIGTYGNGIFIIDNDTLSNHILNLPSTYINKIKRNKDDMWIGTNKGLFKISKIRQDYTIKVLDESDGLFSNEIKDIDISDSKIIVACGKGVSIMNSNIKFNCEVPIPKITNVKINERDTAVYSSYDLRSDQRNVKINFSGIHFNNPNSIQYKYKMQGVDQDWVTTNQNNAQYPSLAPGEYNFLIKVKSLNSIWSNIKKVSFIVPEKFLESFLFKAIVFLGACVLMLLGYNYYYQTLQRKRKYKLMQMTALRAQMNPHFIFNSLNSVQDYILRDDKRAANKYISRFSKLMRYTLNASGKEFTNLKEELDALDIYLSIESMRFDNTLEYTFNISPTLNVSQYHIPSMLLQPYVENAIKHGLMHAPGNKKLAINVKKHQFGLHFEIIDNGVGRKKSNLQKLNNNINHTSKATSITQKRLNLLNKTYQKENKVTFEDIYDGNKKSVGTKVEIFLQSIKFAS